MSHNDFSSGFSPDVPQSSAIIRPTLKRVRQMSEAHCGPAVLEMLLSHHNVNVSQTELAASINADDFIQDRGLRPDELATIIQRVTPHMQLWYKEDTSVEELDMVVNQYRYPVGVEWQGLFYDTPEDEEDAEDIFEEGEDRGHYSIVTSLNVENDTITLRDPYGRFSQHDRFLSLAWFESRWWDENEVWIKSYPTYLRDDRLMFVVTPKGTPFPKWLNMKQM